MRILMLRPFMHKGGSEKLLIRLSEELITMGEEIYLGTAGSEIELSSQITKRVIKIPLYPTRATNFFSSVIAVRKLVRQLSIDLINSHHRFSTAVANFATLNLGVPVVSTVHEMKSPAPLLSKTLVGDYSIVFSPAVEEYLRTKYHQRRNQIFVINPGITTNSVNQNDVVEFSLKYSLDREIPIIACIARLSYEKGIDILIDAVNIVKDHGYYPQVLIVGEGPAKEELIQQSIQNRLEHLIKFIGWIDETEIIYTLTQFLILPSRSEAFGLVILEGLLFEKPSIASNLGGITELIMNGQTGILFSPGDSNELANAIIHLLDSPEQAKFLGRQGKVFVDKNYTTTGMAKRSIELFREIRAYH